MSSRVNGRPPQRRRTGRPVARAGAPRGPRPDRHEDRLQRGPLRRLHGAARRRAGALVHHARPPGRRARGDDDRGPARPSAGRRVRADRRLQCGFCTPGQIVSAAALVARRRRARRETRSGTRWPATSAAAARTRRSRRRSPRGKTDPDREGGRGPLRGGLARRRRGRARPVAGGPARRSSASRRTRIDGLQRARGEARVHGRPPAPRDAPRGRAALARTRARASSGSTSRALAAPGVRAAIGPDDLDVLDGRAGYPGRSGRGGRRRHLRPGARGRSS